MRHYDRAELRNLNDSERYRDYDFIADDGWPPAPEPPSRRPAASAPVPGPTPPLWRMLLQAVFGPHTTIGRILGRLWKQT